MKNKVKEKRIEKGLTQKELGTLAGVSQTTISHIECESFIPAVDTALKVAAVLGATVEELFILRDRPEKYTPI